MDNNNQKFDLWCVVELFGHTQIAGKCTEQNIAGTNMLRVDVPETSKNASFTKFYGSSAIYAINPVTEEYAKVKAEGLQVAPIQSWDIKEMHKRVLALGSAASDPDDEDLPY
jgi:hypothetical protein